MKVIMLIRDSLLELEESINNLIKNRAIIDIKFQVTNNLGNVSYYAMIIYKEDRSK